MRANTARQVRRLALTLTLTLTLTQGEANPNPNPNSNPNPNPNPNPNQVRKLAAQGEEATPLLVPQSSEPATKQVRVHPNPNP